MEKRLSRTPIVLAVSGGPDSVYLLVRRARRGTEVLSAHFNHKARGRDSEEDRKFVERLCGSLDVPLEIGETGSGRGEKAAMAAGNPRRFSGFEERARAERRSFLLKVKADSGARKIMTAHTADDQVETVLMRILEGAGIAGLKGIPRKTADGIERPLLDTWREEIIGYLRKHKIPFRVDKSNFDTRFERNWVRHVLIPLLEKRYGKSVKQRIFALGERFREIDDFLESAAHRWIQRNRRSIPRKSFGKLPSALRMKILQIVCFERIHIAPNERLLKAMERMVMSGRPSARLNVGGGAVLRNRYEETILDVRGSEALTFRNSGNAKRFRPPVLAMETKKKISRAVIRRMTNGEQAAVFDADAIAAPVAVRPLKAGDRIRPFGLDAEKKVKEILIDRKVPREERWGRPVVCDAKGTILWIPGVVRSGHAAVLPGTRRTLVLSFLQIPAKPA